MPIFSPRRFQEPFLPFTRDPLGLRMFTSIERLIKDWLFGCRMCGNCILQETAFICPMTCAKGLRNGPCGEVGDERCVVDPSRPCTWCLIFRRAEKLGHLDKLLEINAPIDGDRAGHETWLDLISHWREWGRKPNPLDIIINKQRFNKEYDQFLYKLRQPEWWEGDACYHPPAYDEPISNLEANLKSGAFTVTADLDPPDDVDPMRIQKLAQMLKGYITSANFSDNAYVVSRLNSLSCSQIWQQAGMEAVMQIQCRDRTRVGLVSDAMGAAALGIRNILCLGGDYHNKGSKPISIPNQLDIDSVQMLWILRRLRDEGIYLDGREIEKRPKYFLGAAGSPFSAPAKYDAMRLEKKVNAGAQFIQTQMIFDHGRFLDWLEQVDKRKILDKAYLLASVMPLRTAADTHPMAEEGGLSMPREILQRMDLAYDKDRSQSGNGDHQLKEGLAISIEMIEKLKRTPGIHGIHLMVGGLEEHAPYLINQTGLPRPVVN